MFLGELLGSRRAALAAQLDSGLILAVLGHLVFYLAGRDLHDPDSSSDHVTGALLAFRALRHGLPQGADQARQRRADT